MLSLGSQILSNVLQNFGHGQLSNPNYHQETSQNFGQTQTQTQPQDFWQDPPQMFGHGQQSTSVPLSQSSTFSTPSFSEIEKEATPDDFMSLMGSSPASSGYHSQSTPIQREDNLLKSGLPLKSLISKAIQLNQLLTCPVGSNDCLEMSKYLVNFYNRGAYKTPFKGPDSFYYCISKVIPNLASSPDHDVMMTNARTLLLKFINENQDFAYVRDLYLIFQKLTNSKNPQ